MSFSNLSNQTFYVVRLKGISQLRCCERVPRKYIRSVYMQVEDFVDEEFKIVTSVAKQYKATILVFNHRYNNFYPIINNDPDIKFSYIPKPIPFV